MSLTLKVIDKNNYLECVNLKAVEDGEESFVASNMDSLLQSFTGEKIYPLAIYRHYTMVGFLLYDYDIALKGWSLSRFMIDKEYQNKGIGKAALAMFMSYFKEHHPTVKELYVGVEVRNKVALTLFQNLGFIKKQIYNYQSDGHTYNEIRMVLNLL